MSQIEQTTNPNEDITKDLVERVEAPVEAPVKEIPLEKVQETKPKKTRTEKQLEAFKKVQQKRTENIAIKKAQPAVVKETPVAPIITEVKQAVKQYVHRATEDKVDDYSDSEEEIIVRRKPKMKPKKRLVIELSDSEDDNVELEERVKEPVMKQRSKFQSQQNSRSKTRSTVFCD